MEKRASRLVEKGGLGLVMFHLAVSNLEFVITTTNSDHGDIWVHNGKTISVLEVKTSTTGSWTIRKSQSHRVQYYAFVHLLDGECWVLSSEELRTKVRRSEAFAGEQWVITQNNLPPESRFAWSKLRGQRKPKRDHATAPTVLKGTKVVRRTLADGTVKEYRYARTSVKNHRKTAPEKWLQNVREGVSKALLIKDKMDACDLCDDQVKTT